MIIVASAGSFILINWTSCFSLAQRVPNLLTESQNNQHTNTYDWSFGVFQYLFGVTVTYAGLVAVESATLSLLSKLSPLRHSVVLNLGTVVVVIGFLARIVADLQLLSVVLSHRLINTDIINTSTYINEQGFHSCDNSKPQPLLLQLPFLFSSFRFPSCF